MLHVADSARRAWSGKCRLVCCSCDFVMIQQWFCDVTLALFRFGNNFWTVHAPWCSSACSCFVCCNLYVASVLLMFQQFFLNVARTVQWETSPPDVWTLAGPIRNQRGTLLYLGHLVNLSTLRTYPYMKLTNIKYSLNYENEHTLPSMMWLEMESQLRMERRGSNANQTGAWIGGLGAWLRDEWVL